MLVQLDILVHLLALAVEVVQQTLLDFEAVLYEARLYEFMLVAHF